MFFALIFLAGKANENTTENTIANIAPLQQSEIDRWGMIPGLLNYNYTRTITIYSRQTYKSDQLVMNIEGPYELYTNRTFANDEWLPTKSCVQYTENYTYVGPTRQEYETIQYMPNLAGLSVWY
jgi:hypothetical protein